MDQSRSLRIELSANYSGRLRSVSSIPILKNDSYRIVDVELDGDAPKQFIRAYFFEPGGKVFKHKPKTWRFFIAKTAEKWYPHESVVEYLINEIGVVLGLKMNKTRLVRANKQIRFLSQYFLDRRDQVMVHGAEVCGEYLQDPEFAKEVADDKNSARELFTFNFILEAIQAVFPMHCDTLLHDLVRMIVFDAIVGNNDRHFYNWAVVRAVKKEAFPPCFAPLYDSARGLMWNWNEDRVVLACKHLPQGGKKVDNYIRKASPRISIEGHPTTNHFELVHYIWRKHTEFQTTIDSLITFSQEDRVLNLYRNNFARYFSAERNLLSEYILKNRFKLLRSVKE